MKKKIRSRRIYDKNQEKKATRHDVWAYVLRACPGVVHNSKFTNLPLEFPHSNFEFFIYNF